MFSITFDDILKIINIAPPLKVKLSLPWSIKYTEIFYLPYFHAGHVHVAAINVNAFFLFSF